MFYILNRVTLNLVVTLILVCWINTVDMAALTRKTCTYCLGSVLRRTRKEEKTIHVKVHRKPVCWTTKTVITTRIINFRSFWLRRKFMIWKHPPKKRSDKKLENFLPSYWEPDLKHLSFAINLGMSKAAFRRSYDQSWFYS